MLLLATYKPNSVLIHIKKYKKIKEIDIFAINFHSEFYTGRLHGGKEL